jgi:hypothetical protein
LSDDVSIINAAADAAKMARLHGCAIDVNIRRFGRNIHVQVTPGGEVELDGLDPHAALEPEPVDQAPAEPKGK